MRLRFNQLSAQLERQLAALYLICGDEPYQLGEAARLVRERARALGFDEREVLEADAGFDWGSLAATAAALSLFSNRKLIDLRILTPRLGKEGGEAIRAFCARPCPDNLLLMVAPALERKELDTQWARAVDGTGAIIQVWPLKGRELNQWIDERLAAVGLRPEPGVAELLAERCEGNLLAAVQEIEKLRLLRDPGPLALDDLLGNLADSARFDLFALTDAALAADRARTQRVLKVLRAEGTASALVLWALARDIRMLAEAAAARARRAPIAPVLARHKVPRMREQTIERALQRLSPSLLQDLLQHCAQADLAIKGLAAQDPWHLLATIADALAASGHGMLVPRSDAAIGVP
ncbi:MAG: DNA polymerase III subunit delta [Bdellovibrio bacteriovorus]